MPTIRLVLRLGIRNPRKEEKKKSYVRLVTGTSPPERARAETGGADQWVFKCTLPLRSLDDRPVPDELFQYSIFDPQDAHLTQHFSREEFDYWIQQLAHDKSLGDDEFTDETWQEAPTDMKDALYQVANQVIQNGHMPTSWEGAHTTLFPKKVGEE